MKRQRAEISSNVISHIKSAYPIKCCRSDKLGIKEKISRGKFPRLIFSCPVPTGLPHRSHCVPMNIIRCGYRLFLWSEWNYRIPRNYEQQKWYSGSRQSVFPPILNREHLRRPIGQGAAFFFSQLRDKFSQSSAIGRRWELSLVLLALDFFF